MKLPFRQEKLIQPVTQLQYPQPKLLEHGPTELLTLTPWLAPIISKGTFDPELLKNMYQPLNLTIGVTVFAVEKILQPFPEFPWALVGSSASSPSVVTPSGRRSPSAEWRPSTNTLPRGPTKKWITSSVSMDVDMVFRNPWGPETLGDLVAAIHPGYFAVPRQQFPYEHWQVSSAFVADSEVDFYYGGAVFGGRVARVYEFTRACHMGILMDKANSIMAAWQEESHLNCYFIWHKPSKVLSPEYLWDDRKPEDDPILLSGKGYNWLRS
uniref:globoside alpha-1,3-N-acetylgalactosaminyltransferase 1-like n=1 Tax=Arvicanthis niloticus TaxID=61156 RepID=UPI0014868CE9|nr:globoside alpha-1,3-N-acetylgalactosaminyltransferase 1-like [Arvicanthis niloticus]